MLYVHTCSHDRDYAPPAAASRCTSLGLTFCNCSCILAWPFREHSAAALGAQHRGSHASEDALAGSMEGTEAPLQHTVIVSNSERAEQQSALSVAWRTRSMGYCARHCQVSAVRLGVHATQTYACAHCVPAYV